MAITSRVRSRRLVLLSALLLVLALVLPVALSASIYTYCDSYGRLWVMIIDDETGVMTGYMHTVSASSQCT